uniref:Ig-like domain-containing protein n=1 Tax=Stegastes partitus TaxID=144197 RepID=A0A3B5AUU1_9TELE
MKHFSSFPLNRPTVYGLSFVTKTVGVGQDVTLTCSRNSTAGGILFWFRLVAGNLPEVLGTTYFYGHATSNETPRITAKLGPGTFVLRITQTKRSDTALYYCEKIAERRKSSSNVTFLTVKGKWINISFNYVYDIFLQTEEDSLVYSVPNFTRKKNGRRVREGAEVVEGESIYADVRVLGYE